MKVKTFKDVNYLLHGGDYNPEQWIEYPEILEKDIELLKKANINCVSMGIFSWAKLEPSEGVFDFAWLDKIINDLHKNDIKIILATPSGARPVWLSEKYPEVLRKDPQRRRQLHSFRHNHCYSSLVYREKVKIINQELAKRYSNHPAILLWHISNEFNGDCHCELCEANFQKWLEKKYGTIEKLNHEWWTTFWSKTFTSFDQIRIPGGISETAIQGLNLDYKEFITYQTIDFYKAEVKAIKEIGTEIPFTTNFMNLYEGLDYLKFGEEVDVVANDSYPAWHNRNNVRVGCRTSLIHSMYRCVKHKPFLLMESTPSTTNWQQISKLKKPGMHKLASIQAIAEGSDSVLYFQIRQSRGSYEKFHSAVISHDNSEHNRVFKEVSEVGKIMKQLDAIQGTPTNTEVGIVLDWPNRWAITGSMGPRNKGMKFEEILIDWYEVFYTQGIQTDVIGKNQKLDKYKLLIVPMMYMIDEKYAKKLEEYVRNGGTLITSYFTGYVNNSDLCYIGGFPGPLKELLGITINEIDSLYDFESNGVVLNDNKFNMTGTYQCTEICELIELSKADALASYESDFYQGSPAVTINKFGNGQAIHVGTRVVKEFNLKLISNLVKQLGIKKVIETDVPDGVSLACRSDGDIDYVFVMNFNDHDVTIKLDDHQYIDYITKEPILNKLSIAQFDVKILKR